MHSIATWTTRIKWLLIAVLLVWGAFFWATGYTECRADGTNNIVCGIVAVFVAYLGVLLHIIVAVVSFLAWVLP